MIVLHTEAPREFDDDVLNFLVHTASLVAGAIENAQLYEDTRRRVDALTTLTQLSQALAAVTAARGPLRRGHARRAPAARRGRLPDLAARPRGRRAGRWPAPIRRTTRRGRARAALLLDLMRRGRTGAVEDDGLLVAPLVAGDEQLGILCCVARERVFDDEDAELLHAVANQTAVGLKKAELIERLTAENIVKDMFDALAAGAVRDRRGQGGEARCDLSRPHVFLHVERAPDAGPDRPPGRSSPRAVRGRLRRLYPRAFFDSRHDWVRAIAPLPTASAAAVERAAAALRGAGAARRA